MKNNRIKFKQTNKKTGKNSDMTWAEELPKRLLSSFSVGDLLLGTQPALRGVCFPSATHWGKWLSIGDCFWVRERGTCPLFLSAVGHRLLQLTCVGQMHAACL